MSHITVKLKKRVHHASIVSPRNASPPQLIHRIQRSGEYQGIVEGSTSRKRSHDDHNMPTWLRLNGDKKLHTSGYFVSMAIAHLATQTQNLPQVANTATRLLLIGQRDHVVL